MRADARFVIIDVYAAANSNRVGVEQRHLRRVDVDFKVSRRKAVAGQRCAQRVAAGSNAVQRKSTIRGALDRRSFVEHNGGIFKATSSDSHCAGNIKTDSFEFHLQLSVFLELLSLKCCLNLPLQRLPPPSQRAQPAKKRASPAHSSSLREHDTRRPASMESKQDRRSLCAACSANCHHSSFQPSALAH